MGDQFYLKKKIIQKYEEKISREKLNNLSERKGNSRFPLSLKKKIYVNASTMDQNQVVLTRPQSSAMPSDHMSTRTHVSRYKRPKPSIPSGLRRLGSGLLPPIMVDIKIFMVNILF